MAVTGGILATIYVLWYETIRLTAQAGLKP